MSDTTGAHRQQLLRGLTYDQLYMARTIASSGSFREASKILCLTQPAISQRVQHIEQVLGMPIFDRHAGIGVTLTDAGRTFLDFCDRAISDIDVLWSQLATAEESDKAAAITVTAPGDSIQHFIIRMLPFFRTKFPHRTIRLRQAESRAETLHLMESGQSDLAFYRMPVEGCLSTIAMMNERLFLVAAPRHPIFSIPVEERAAVLHQFSLATYSPNMRSRQLIERWALKEGGRLTVDIESRSLHVMKEAMIHGGTLAVVPGLALGEELEEGRLSIVEIAGMPLPRATAIAVSSDGRQPPGVHEFVQRLVDYCHTRADESTPDIRWATGAAARLGEDPVAV